VGEGETYGSHQSVRLCVIHVSFEIPSDKKKGKGKKDVRKPPGKPPGKPPVGAAVSYHQYLFFLLLKTVLLVVFVARVGR
jgi:hypothetical protein